MRCVVVFLRMGVGFQQKHNIINGGRWEEKEEEEEKDDEEEKEEEEGQLLQCF